jgi:hypothetical protein
MAVMAELHGAIFIEPRPDDDCCRDEEYQEEERKTLFWEERKARSIELEEQQQLLKQRCARLAELRIKEEETKALTPSQRRLSKRLERLLKDFPEDQVVQELRRMGIF